MLARVPALAVVTCALLVLLSPAQARMAALCSASQPAKQELRCGWKNWYHAQGNLRFLKAHPRAGTKERRAELRQGMLWLRDYARQHISTAQTRLHPLPAHHALWQCLHPHEAIDWHNQDTGGNGHYGGLQMSYNWLGIVHGNPANLSPLAQEWAAETGYRQSGYSSAWLWGQWQQTLGFCTKYI